MAAHAQSSRRQQTHAGFYLSRLSAAYALAIPAIGYADLNNVPGMTEAEASTAAMVQALCPQMAAISGDLTAPQSQLFFECRALVQTSNSQQGSGPTGNDLGYDEAELREALSQIAHQEVAIEANTATDTIDGQFDTIASRMSALRRGGIGGSTGGLSMNMDGDTILANLMTGGSAGAEDSGWSIYVNGNYNFGDRENTERESGFDYDNYGVTFGLDRRLGIDMVIGVALSLSKSESDVSDNGGTFEDEGQAFSAYLSHTFANDIYVDIIATAGMTDYDTLRRVRLPTPTNTVPNVLTDDDITGSTEGEQTAFSIGIGRDYRSESGGMDFGLFGRAEFYRGKIDGYDEQGSGGTSLELQMQEQVVDSATVSLGAQISRASSHSFGILVPQARAEFHHELENDSRGITARYIHDPFNTGAFLFSVPTDNPDRNFGTAGFGVSLVTQSGMQLFGFYETSVALDYMTNHSVIFGLRQEL